MDTINTDDSPYVRFCLDWTLLPDARHKVTDIDSIVHYVNSKGNVVDESYYGQLATRDGAVQHRQDYIVNGDLVPSHDHLTEQFDVQLNSINHAVQEINVYVTSAYPLASFLSRVTFSVEQPVTKDLYVHHLTETVSDTPESTHTLFLRTLTRREHNEWGIAVAPAERLFMSVSGVKELRAARSSSHE